MEGATHTAGNDEVALARNAKMVLNDVVAMALPACLRVADMRA